MDDTEDYVVQIGELCERLHRKYKVPGVAVAIVHDGEVEWAQGLGYADKANNVPMTPDTVLQVASISKSVTAWGVMSLVEEGKLELDAPVEQYLTRWHLPESEYDIEGVTIRRLLSHTAGLSLHGYPGFHPDEELPSLEDSLSGDTGGAGSVRIVHEPGTKWDYSGGGYTLLQLIIEEVTGESFADFMQTTVLEPLGMSNSSFEWSETMRSKTAKPYDFFGREMPNYLFTAKAAAGLYTTAPDLARFIAAAMTGSNGESIGRDVLLPETVQLMLTAQPATDGKFGLGYFLDAPPEDIFDFNHGGGNEGWKTKFIGQPGTGEGIVILTNSDRGLYLLREAERHWLAWVNGTKPAEIDPFADRYITLGIAVLLGILCVIYVWRKAVSLRQGKSRFSGSLSRRKLVKLLSIVVLAILWWVGLYTGIIFVKYLPVTFSWVTLAVTLWCIVGITSSFIIKAE